MKFTDARGREWDLTLSVYDLKRLREAGLIDLAELARDHQKFLDVMFLRGDELTPVLWALADRKQTSLGFKITEDEFMDAVTAPVLDAAVVALWRAFADLFPRSALGIKIRTDGPEKVMRDIEAAILAGPDEPPPATEPTPVPEPATSS